jgi:hypothetical protein
MCVYNIAEESELLTGPPISSIIYKDFMGNEKKILLTVNLMETPKQDFFMPAYLECAYAF